MKNRTTAFSNRPVFSVLGALLPTLGVWGCTMADVESEPQQEGAIARVTAALDANTVISTTFDDTAAPVHIQIRACKSTTAAATHQVDCKVNAEYAVVGGGALPAAASGGSAKAYITESRPVDPRTWRASSVEPTALAHDLTVYAIGMRLDGVNTQKLRDAIGWKTANTTSTSVSAYAESGKRVLGGGAATAPDPGVIGNRVLTGTAWSGASGWNARSRPESGTVAGTTQVTLLQIDKKIIEGFGALEVQARSGSARGITGGSQTTSLSVTSGWALASLGAIANTSSGPIRRITGIIPDATGRHVTINTGDANGSSLGSTAPYLTQVRKMPGSHGLCNPGGPLLTSMDSCVASVCAARSECCSSGWDSTCVSMVETTCGRSCAQDTCVPSVFEPTKWQNPDGTAIASNCYYYAQNKLPDGKGMDPGASLNPDPEEFTAPRLAALAAGDGLLPSSFSGVCPDNRTKVMLTCNSNLFNYHWYRQDVGGLWSNKFATWGQALIKENTGYRPYTDVQNNTYESFFCACNTALP